MKTLYFNGNEDFSLKFSFLSILLIILICLKMIYLKRLYELCRVETTCECCWIFVTHQVVDKYLARFNVVLI